MHTSWLWARFTFMESCSTENMLIPLKADPALFRYFLPLPNPHPQHTLHLSFKATSFSISPLFEKPHYYGGRSSCLAFIILVKDSDILPFFFSLTLLGNSRGKSPLIWKGTESQQLGTNSTNLQV